MAGGAMNPLQMQDFRSRYHVPSEGNFSYSNHPKMLIPSTSTAGDFPRDSRAMQPTNVTHPMFDTVIQESDNSVHAPNGGTYLQGSHPNTTIGTENPLHLQDFSSSRHTQSGEIFPNGRLPGTLLGSQALQPPNITHPILHPPIQEFNNRTHASDGGTYPLASRPNIAIGAENPFQMQDFRSSHHVQSGGIFLNSSHPGTLHDSQALRPPNIIHPILNPPIQEFSNRTHASDGGTYSLASHPNAVRAENPFQIQDFRSSHHIQSGGNFPNGSHPGTLHGGQALQPPNITRPILYPPVQEFDNRTHDGGTYPLASRPNIAVAAENPLQMQGFKSSNHMQSGGIFANCSHPGTSHNSQALQPPSIARPILYLPVQEFNNRTHASDGGTYPLASCPNIAVAAENPLQMQGFKSSDHMQSGGIFSNRSHPGTSHGSQALQPPNITHPILYPIQEFNNRTDASDGGTCPLGGRPNIAVGGENTLQTQDFRSSHYIQSRGSFPNGSHPGTLHGSQALQPPDVTRPILYPPIQESDNRTHASDGGTYPLANRPNIAVAAENPLQMQDFKSSHHMQSGGIFPNGSHLGTSHGSQALQPPNIAHPTLYPRTQEYNNGTHASDGGTYPLAGRPNTAVGAENPSQMQDSRSSHHIQSGGIFPNGSHPGSLAPSTSTRGDLQHGSQALRPPSITHPVFNPPTQEYGNKTHAPNGGTYPQGQSPNINSGSENPLQVQDFKSSHHIQSEGSFPNGNHPGTHVPSTIIGGNLQHGSQALQPCSITHPTFYPLVQEFDRRTHAPNGAPYPPGHHPNIAIDAENPVQVQGFKSGHHIPNGVFSNGNHRMPLIQSTTLIPSRIGGNFPHCSPALQLPYNTHPMFSPHMQEFNNRAHAPNGRTYPHESRPEIAMGFENPLQMQDFKRMYHIQDGGNFSYFNRSMTLIPSASAGGRFLHESREWQPPYSSHPIFDPHIQEFTNSAHVRNGGTYSQGQHLDIPIGASALQMQNKGLAYYYRVANREALHGDSGVDPEQEIPGPDHGNKKPAGSATREEAAEEAAAEALHNSFGAGSYARKVLESMGWKEGEALGKKKKGLLEPLKVSRHKGCSGLGWNKRRKIRDEKEVTVPILSVGDEMEDLVPVNCVGDETEGLVPVDCVRDGIKDLVPSECVQDDSEDPIPVDTVYNETEDLVPVDCARDETEDLVSVDCVRDGIKDFVLSDCVQDDSEDPIPVDNVCNETEDLVPADCRDETEDLVPSDCVPDDPEDPIPVNNVRNETEDLVPVDCVRDVIKDLVPSDCVQDDSEDPIPVDNVCNETEDLAPVNWAGDETQHLVPVDCVRDGIKDLVPSDCVQDNPEDTIPVDNARNEAEDLIPVDYARDVTKDFIPVDCVQDELDDSVPADSARNETEGPVSVHRVGNETEALVSGCCVGDEAEGSIPVDCVGDETEDLVSIQCVGDGMQDHAPVHRDAYT